MTDSLLEYVPSRFETYLRARAEFASVPYRCSRTPHSRVQLVGQQDRRLGLQMNRVLSFIYERAQVAPHPLLTVMAGVARGHQRMRRGWAGVAHNGLNSREPQLGLAVQLRALIVPGMADGLLTGFDLFAQVQVLLQARLRPRVVHSEKLSRRGSCVREGGGIRVRAS